MDHPVYHVSPHWEPPARWAAFTCSTWKVSHQLSHSNGWLPFSMLSIHGYRLIFMLGCRESECVIRPPHQRWPTPAQHLHDMVVITPVPAFDIVSGLLAPLNTFALSINSPLPLHTVVCRAEAFVLGCHADSFTSSPLAPDSDDTERPIARRERRFQERG